MTKQDLALVFHSCDLVTGGLDVGVARCVADRMVRAFTAAQLNDPHLDPHRVLQTIQPCRKQA